ncbi:hypothetical protein DPMN_185149 [Dreissena polymorpha]|uniref:Uncharacterized protein n=1 Tax=Dreissena polymorpha TaxID=45954 RepID=A0A9D4DJY5_DREPO|nr:hypothetical protein DPMN_185149 [Dreissena polymorpha]
MSQQQRAAALLRQAADLLNVNTSDRSTQYQHLHHAAKAIVHPTHWTITPRCNQRDTSTEVNQINWSYKQLKKTLQGASVLGTPGLVMWPCIVEIDRIVIRDIQYNLEVNRCRNEEENVFV